MYVAHLSIFYVRFLCTPTMVYLFSIFEMDLITNDFFMNAFLQIIPPTILS